MLKKILIASVAFFIIAIGVAGYFLFIKKPVSNSPEKTVVNNLPFGNPSGTTNLGKGKVVAIGGTTTQTTAGSLVTSRLVHLSTVPVAGATTYNIGSTTIVRYTEQGTAHVSDVNLSTGTTSEISNTTIADIHEALWLNNAKSVILRYPDQTNAHAISYAANLVPATSTSTPQELQGLFLPNNIESISTSPDNKKIFYLVLGGNGEEGIVANPDGSKGSVLINSSFLEWLGSWPNLDTIALSTKPTAGISGNLYFISTKTRLMKPIMSDISGMIALVNPQASLVAYSDDNVNLSIFNVSTGSHTGVAQTLADKCVWSKKQPKVLYCGVPNSVPTGQYPDSWYQGSISFTDAVYKINTETAQTVVLSDLQNSYGQNIDIINPSLSADENYFLFTNKKDGTLWSYRVSQ